ncbi:MAG: hypothetical protein WA989_00945 [Henriciella sp.]|uniref:hypothetical protein n=1 Tax=Henriciella sp. TaxID=1968823 RepID=UPI003C74B0FC
MRRIEQKLTKRRPEGPELSSRAMKHVAIQAAYIFTMAAPFVGLVIAVQPVV